MGILGGFLVCFAIVVFSLVQERGRVDRSFFNVLVLGCAAFLVFGRRLACLEFAGQKHDGLSIQEGAEGDSSVFIRVHLWL